MTQKTIVHRQQASKDQPKQTSYNILHLVSFVYYIDLTFLLLKLGSLVQGFAAYIQSKAVDVWKTWKACRSCSSSSFMALFPWSADDVERSQFPQDLLCGTATSSHQVWRKMSFALALLFDKRGNKLSKKFDPAWGDVNHVINNRRMYHILWIGELFYSPREI